MSTKFEYTINLNGNAKAVLTMLQSQNFLDARVEQSDSGTASISKTDVGFVTTLERCDSLADIPAYIRKLTGPKIDWTESQTWPSDPDANGITTGELQIKATGKPALISASAKLSETASGSKIVFIGEIDVDLPLIGGKVEGFIAGFIDDAFEDTESVGNQWLSRN